MEQFELRLGKSKFLFILFLFIYIGSSLILFFLDIPYYFKILGITLIIFELKKSIQIHATRSSKNAIIRICQDIRHRHAKGVLICETRQLHACKGVLAPGSYKCPWLFILRIKLKSRNITVIIPFDAVNTAEYRNLSTRFNLLR